MSIKIPVKCDENWDSMSHTSQGMLCSRCNIEVIDFTDWKTEDIVTYVQRSKTKVGGKLLNTQSHTSYKSNLKNKLYFSKLRLGLIMSGLLFAKFVKAEYHIENTLYEYFNEQKDLKDSITIKGIVIDESRRPLNGVHIYNILTKESSTTDDKGRFILKFSNEQNFRFLRLSFSYVGYDIREVVYDLSKNARLKVELTEASHEIGEVIVTDPRARAHKNIDLLKHPK
ncbi:MULTISPECIES: carboxypeptidase-like regulatory domain-containing protein [unclassified Sphingobacterium]|uniref:carboxypeptidase-like regulatory domain-containing protein n=1 Tax=unclassified Sphingobacterium TaxID=2609468 RepID=UPI001050F836|nr:MULTISPECIES: carboxypeptidase-like regulatory domain-containing protein [unclassified Sphingobacterium]MCS3552697.1 hypothetical protein [Sphingobacterium sp. JUb21]TCR10545.1 carboxypeptidase-like protein [Sphingobacterium sp. JUb20]